MQVQGGHSYWNILEYTGIYWKEKYTGKYTGKQLYFGDILENILEFHKFLTYIIFILTLCLEKGNSFRKALKEKEKTLAALQKAVKKLEEELKNC